MPNLGYETDTRTLVNLDETFEPVDELGTVALWTKLYDNSVVCYDRGSQYGEYALNNGDVVKLSGSDWRYMICEEYDLNHYETGLGTGGVNEDYTGKPWGFYGISTGAEDTAIGTGKNNTDQLITQNNNDSDTLWYYVNQHRTNTGKDWSVPSKDELNILYENNATIGNFTVNLTNYTYYWSSSEYSSYCPWYQRFSSGAQYNVEGKDATGYRIRCIRYV